MPNGALGESNNGLSWGRYNMLHSTSSLTEEMTNLTTLAGFGQVAHPVAHPVAYFCRNLSIGSYSTVWSLPSAGELNHIYLNLSASGKLLATLGTHPGKCTSATYLTSTEYSNTYAWYQDMYSESQHGVGGDFRQGLYRVRAYRTI